MLADHITHLLSPPAAYLPRFDFTIPPIFGMQGGMQTTVDARSPFFQHVGQNDTLSAVSSVALLVTSLRVLEEGFDDVSAEFRDNSVTAWVLPFLQLSRAVIGSSGAFEIRNDFGI